MTEAVEYHRHADYLPLHVARAAHVAVIGAGGIGSPSALALARLGIGRLSLLDDDVVEPHNVSSQHFTLSDLGDGKVEALARHCRAVGAPTVDAIAARVPAAETLVALRAADIIVSGVDSMASRSAIWASRVHWCAQLYLDLRLGGEQIVCYAVHPTDPASVGEYTVSLYDDAEAVDLPCTARGVVDVGLIAAALAARSVRRALAGAALAPAAHIDWASLATPSQPCQV